MLANHAEDAPVPVPIEPVEATVTGGTLYLPYRILDDANPPNETNHTYTYTPYKIGYEVQGVPINYTAYSDFLSLYSDTDRTADCWIYPTKGSFILTIGNTLTPGNYIFEVVHFIGLNANYWSGSPRKPSTRAEVNYSKTRIVKGGAYGIIDAELNPIQQEYQEINASVMDYSTRTIETRVRYAFSITEGDTTKTFSWGQGTDIDLADLWNTVHIMHLNTDGKTNSHFMGAWANAKIYFNITVYTAR